ncbi:MAG TPA: redoxin domain-containing protein [Vicinamibacteria bacterium]
MHVLRAGALALAAVLDLAGHPVDPRPGPGARPAVLVFVRTDCPIANRYAPELRRLQDRFAGKGVAFWLVYPDPSETPDAIRRHQRDFGLGFHALRDPQHELVKATRATVTPEAAVFVAGAAGPRMVYRGRIDDRYVDFGRSRPAPTSRDLREVLQALAAGRTLASRTTPAVGCFIAPLE